LATQQDGTPRFDGGEAAASSAVGGQVLRSGGRSDITALGPLDRLADRPFTDPGETHGDLLVMTDMLARERTIARTWPRGAAGPGIREQSRGGSRQLLAVPDGNALLDASDVTAVGFFGQLRGGVDHSVLFELEREVAATFPEYAAFGFLSYFDLGPYHGRYGNLILFWTLDVPEEWHANPAHLRAVAAAPEHYDCVRLHKGRIAGPFLDGRDLRIRQTVYLDFRGTPPWRAVRTYGGGGRVS
jgi:hypothetical protein